MKKRNADEQSTLNRIGGLTKAMLAQKLPGLDSLAKARNKLNELVVTAKAIDTMGLTDRVSDEFIGGLDQVLLSMRSFRSGYASNDASQVIDPNAIPGFAPTNTVKTAKSEGKRIPISPDFVNYAAGIFKGLAKMDIADQLAALRGLEHAIMKANEEDFSDVLIPTSNDPDKQKADVTEGSIMSLAGGTSAPQTAPTNFATTPPPAAGGAGGASSTAAATSGGDSGTSGTSTVNFATTDAPAAANAGPAAGTGAVAAAAGGAGETGTAPTNFAATEVAGVNKGATVAAEDLNAIEKGMIEAEEVADWGGDLTRSEFMTGRRNPAKDFGRDGQK